MLPVDPENGRSRGYMIVGKGLVSESLLFTIDRSRYREWQDLAKWLKLALDMLPSKVKEDKERTIPYTWPL